MKLIVEQKQQLANLYILPFIKKRELDFKTFVKCYVDIEDFCLVVEVSEMEPRYKDYAHFKYSVTKRVDVELLFYDIPVDLHEDVAMFVDGRYSKFSDKAKALIRKYGNFIIKVDSTGNIKEESIWLHVLNKSDNLRKQLEFELGCSTIPFDVELASKPHKNNFL